MTNDEYIKSLIKLEEHLYEKFREVQQLKYDKIVEMFNSSEIRCNNCKTKMRTVKNSFFKDRHCETCFNCSDVERKNRKDIYKFVDNKWKKTKILNNGWWYNKI